MLAGIEMPHYLSLTNMFTKFLGLICTLAAGSTVFLGKVVSNISVYHVCQANYAALLRVTKTIFFICHKGPFVHLSTMVGAYLSNLCTLTQANKKVKPQYSNSKVVKGLPTLPTFLVVQ